MDAIDVGMAERRRPLDFRSHFVDDGGFQICFPEHIFTLASSLRLRKVKHVFILTNNSGYPQLIVGSCHPDDEQRWREERLPQRGGGGSRRSKGGGDKSQCWIRSGFCKN